MSQESDILLSVESLTLTVGAGTILGSVSFDIRRGEFFSLVGESGSGKSMLAQSIIGLPQRIGMRATGAVRFGGLDLLSAPETTLRSIRGRQISFVFQEPMSALNPIKRIGRQLGDAVRAHHRGLSRGEVDARVRKALEAAQLARTDQVMSAYPHQLSGGMRQRVCIALALVNDATLIVADEPTTALDVEIQKEILELLRDLCRSRGKSVLFISHDIGLVSEFSDRIGVLYGGVLVEHGEAGAVIGDSRHPYTQGLISSMPMRRVGGKLQQAMEGTVPAIIDWPAGCRFRPRCRLAGADCEGPIPEFRLPGAHRVRCVRAVQNVEPPR